MPYLKQCIWTGTIIIIGASITRASDLTFATYDIGNLGCSDYAVAWGINDLGVVAGSAIVPDCQNDGNAILWENGVITNLSLESTGASIGSSNDISNTGVVVASADCPNQVAIVIDGVAVSAPTPVECENNGVAEAINTSGTIIPGTCDVWGVGYVPAIYWINSGKALALMETLPRHPVPSNGYARGVNDDGVVTGYFSYPGSYGARAFIWQDGVMTELENLLGGEIITAYAISNSGFIAGGAETASGGTCAMRYDMNTGEMIDLGDGGANDVNERGDAVGSDIRDFSYKAALLYKDGEAIDLMPYLPSYMVEGVAWGINNNGWIVGYADEGTAITYWGWLLVPLYSKGDFDGDEDVDLHDFGHFQRCFAAEPYQGPEGGLHVGCSVFDFDDDVDLDLTDYDAFQSAFTGAITSGW